MSNPNDAIYWHPGNTLASVEKQVIQKAHVHYRNKTVTATTLGISVRTLDKRLDEYAREDAITELMEQDRANERERFLAKSRGQPLPEAGEPLDLELRIANLAEQKKQKERDDAERERQRTEQLARSRGEKIETGICVEPTQNAAAQ